MPAFDYTRSKASAVRLINRFGRAATLVQVSDSGSARNPTQTETSTAVTVVDLNERERDLSGGLTGRVTRVVLISTESAVVPVKGDHLTIDGITHEVHEVATLSPGGVDILYQARLAH